jgi:hypothetical protein
MVNPAASPTPRKGRGSRVQGVGQGEIPLWRRKQPAPRNVSIRLSMLAAA